MAAATGLVATSNTGASGEVRCNASVARRAGTPWRASTSERRWKQSVETAPRNNNFRLALFAHQS
jgi:hypothetical protein